MNLTLSNRVIVDTGPLIAIAHLDWFNIVKGLFSEIIITQSVFAESQHGKEKPGALRIRKAVKNTEVSIKNFDEMFDETVANLGKGEISSIALAKELNVPLLLDDKLARRQARKQNINVLGTAGLLILVKRKGLVKNISPSLNALLEHGYYLSDELINHIKILTDE